MVSQRGREPTSRERLLSAAALEFAARGFDGATVDRIARRARVNKAMLYYHFPSKIGLYRAILLDLFGTLAAAVAAGRAEGGAPPDQIRRFIRTVAAGTAARPHFPAIWLREMAEGGRHLDAAIVRQLRAIIGVLAGILQEGRRQRVFVDAHPLVTQMGIVAPLLLFAASAPARARFGRTMRIDVAAVPREVVVAHVETATLAALTSRPGSRVRPRSSSRRSS